MGFEEFFKEFERYPTALEIDKFRLLPSARQIQRRFNGLKSLRKSFKLPISDYGSGEARRKIARVINARGKEKERNFRNILVSRFGEMFVHEQKPFNNYKSRVDFFIYAKNYQFGVDVFFPSCRHNFQGCINLKGKIYKTFPNDIYLVNVNKEIRPNIREFLINKKNKLAKNIHIYHYKDFIKLIESIEPIRITFL